MEFIKQCKGKDLSKVAKSKLDEGAYLCSKKFDGNYVQIHKFGNEVTFYTSSGISFFIEDVAERLVSHNEGIDFIIETEYIGTTNGKLGSRGKSTTTTFRTNSKKGILNFAPDCKFVMFDVLYHNKDIMHLDFHTRLTFMNRIVSTINIGKTRFEMMDLSIAKMTADNLIKEGWEGFFCKKMNHSYLPGKRVNDAIKLKQYPKKTLPFVGVKAGEGKYEGMIGSLILQDEDGTLIYVAGISDDLRGAEGYQFQGAMVTFEYESFNKTYIQARVKDIVW